MTTAVENELQKATGVKAGKGNRQAYLEKLVVGVSELQDAKFNKLSADASAWFKEAEAAYNAEHDIPEFSEDDVPAEAGDGDEETGGKQEQEDAGEQQDTASSERPTAGARRGRRTQADNEEGNTMTTAKKKAAAKSNGKAPAAKKAAAPKKKAVKAMGQGAPTLIKQMVLKNPEISTAELTDKLKAKGLKVSSLTVSSIRSGFRHSIRILNEAGHCKNIEV